MNELNALAEKYASECKGGEYDYFCSEHFVKFCEENGLKAVVRCRDCKSFKPKEKICVKKIRAGGIHAVDKVRPNFFCADGCRKNEIEE